jgi:hypothetical protein
MRIKKKKTAEKGVDDHKSIAKQMIPPLSIPYADEVVCVGRSAGGQL